LRASGDDDGLSSSARSRAAVLSGPSSSESGREATDGGIASGDSIAVGNTDGTSSGNGGRAGGGLISAGSAGNVGSGRGGDGASGSGAGELGGHSSSGNNSYGVGGRLVGASGEPVGDGYRVLASVEGVEVESTSRVSGLGSVGRASTLSGSSGESNGSTTKTWLARFLESVTLAVNEDNTGQITSLGRAENPERSTGSVSGGDNNILRGAGS